MTWQKAKLPGLWKKRKRDEKEDFDDVEDGDRERHWTERDEAEMLDWAQVAGTIPDQA